MPHTLLRNGWLEISYSSQQEMVEDFLSRGFDKFEVSSMEGVSDITRRGLECGAGSQRLARMEHVISFDGDFEIEVSLWLSFSSGRSVVVFTMGKKFGVSFGQQIVKISKKGRLKRLSSVFDPNVFSRERVVTVNLTFKDQVLVVRCNGRKTAQRRFKAGELSGPFGLLAKDVRLQITKLELKGTVDDSKL